jgi:hypothetical protein
MAAEKNYKLMCAIIAQIQVAGIDWGKVAEHVDAPNGHATSNRWWRFRQDMATRGLFPKVTIRRRGNATARVRLAVKLQPGAPTSTAKKTSTGVKAAKSASIQQRYSEEFSREEEKVEGDERVEREQAADMDEEIKDADDDDMEEQRDDSNVDEYRAQEYYEAQMADQEYYGLSDEEKKV